MKMIKTALLAASACLALITPLRAQEEANAIEAVNVAQQGNDIAVRIDLRQPLVTPPAGFSVASPARVAFDFPATVNALGSNSQVLNVADLRSFNVVQVGDRTRLVLNLISNMNYSTRLDGNSLYVTLTPIIGVGESATQRATRFAEESLLGGQHALRDVVFRRGKDGEGRIVVDLSDAGTGIDIRRQGPNLIVDFIKTTVPEHLQRRLDVTDFATPVTRVETSSMGDNVRMTISPTGLWEHNAYQSDNQFVVEVSRIIEDPNKLVQGTKTGYQGPRVSINYQNGDVRALLRLMAEELGLNAVISETVTGTTTLVLKDVPADHVIDIIFQQKGLDMRKKSNVMMIAPRDEIATREKLDFEARQQINELEPLQSEQFTLNYHRADAVAKLLAGLSPLSGGGDNSALRMLSKRGSTISDTQSNLLFVTDIPSKLDEIRAFIKAVDIGARQVMIEARVVEAKDTFNRDIGVKLGFINSKRTWFNGGRVGAAGGSYDPGTSSSSTTRTYENGVLTTTKTEDKTTPAILNQIPMGGVNLPAGGNRGGSLALTLFNSDATRILNLELSALENDGAGKIISSPRVITANNVKAKIEDGTEVPYVSTQSLGGGMTQTVEFKSAKLVLEATPQITPEGMVRMTLVVKKEEPDWSRAILENPPIKSSIVETDVIVENGGTVVIGGVFVTNNETNTEKVPLLGDIPFLGWLFKYQNKLEERRELLVFITPRIMSDKLRLN